MTMSAKKAGRSQAFRRGLAKGVSLVMAIAATLVVALAFHSFHTADTVSLAARYSGSAADGRGWESWVTVERGTARISINQERWQYDNQPSPMPDNHGLHIYSFPAAAISPPVPTPEMASGVLNSHELVEAHGFDRLGFGAGRLSSRWTSAGTSTTRSHAAIRVPLWFISLVLLVYPAFYLIGVLRLRLNASTSAGGTTDRLKGNSHTLQTMLRCRSAG
jgi:hypothetical protein